jgi:hypothetical protein
VCAPAGYGGQAHNHAMGHLLARQLRGPGQDPRNIATLLLTARIANVGRETRRIRHRRGRSALL